MRVKGFVLIEDEIFHVDATPETWSLKKMDHRDNRNRLVIIGNSLKQQEIEAGDKQYNQTNQGQNSRVGSITQG